MSPAKRIVLGVGGFFLILIGAILYQANTKQDQLQESIGTSQMTVYKSPTCGCCGGYVSHMKRQGFDVDVVQQNNISGVKQTLGVPETLKSCHTSVIGDYVVEGHIPEEVIEKLLVEKPDVLGIALPDMPNGSPGMPGIKKEPFVIYSFDNDGSISEYTRY